MLNEVRGYFSEHKDIILTLLFVILVDHFIFDGSFREKLKALLDSMINKVSKNINRSRE